MTFADGTILTVSESSIQITGKSPSGEYGYWVLKRKERIYLNEPTLRYKRYSIKELKQTIKEL